MILPANLAGSFYPKNVKHLRLDIKGYLQRVELEKSYTDVLGIIAPHAGYYYSGQCAAYGYKALQNNDYDRVIIIAPCHRSRGFQYAIGDFDSLETPLGNLNTDREYIDKLLEEDGFEALTDVFINENAMETQLPFIAYINPKIKVIPILLGNQTLDSSIKLAEKLASVFNSDFRKIFIVASSDLSHYYNSNIAEVLDSNLIQLIKRRDLANIEKSLHEGEIEACGIGPIMTLVKLADLQDYKDTEILNYTHSGEVSGDNQQVVGYLSALFAK